VLDPLVDNDLCFVDVVEDLPVQQRITQDTIKALAIAILLSTIQLDIRGMDL
jgi:hypothetical protein